MIFDLHNDLITAPLSATDRSAAIEKSARSAAAVVMAFWATTRECLPEPSEIPSAPNIHFAVEDMHFFNFDSAEKLLALNPVYCGLTWNGDNRLAGGCGGKSGVTPFGRRVIDFLARHDIAVDTAHLNERSFYEVAECAPRILDSHCFIYDLVPHPRNLRFSQIEVIVRRGGIVGLTPLKAFVGDSIADYVRGIDAFTQRFGDDSLAIGTDYYGSDDFCAGLEDYAGFAPLAERLDKLGYKAATIEKIFYKNAANFFAPQENTK